MFKNLEKLCTLPAPSGCEEAVFTFLEKELSPYADSISKDAMGNLIVHKQGPGKKVMFCAHMDEIGLVATCFGEKGEVYVAPLGGVSSLCAAYQQVRFVNGVTGVLVPGEKPADLGAQPSLSKFYVDIGAHNMDEAASKVSVGLCAVFAGTYTQKDDVIISKALDNRAGCFVLAEGIKRAKEWKNDLYFVFTVSEELGLRGAKAVAESIQPDYCIALDVTPTGDVASTEKNAVTLSGGVAIKIMDKSILVHPVIKDALINLCETENIPYQKEVLSYGGNDAGAVHTSGGGVPSGCISIPLRYVHSPGEMASVKDIKNAIALTVALIGKGLD